MCFRGGAIGSARGAEAYLRRHYGSKYILRRIFPPISYLAISDPIVKERPYLAPFSCVKRWHGALREKGKLKYKLRSIAKTSSEQINELDVILNDLDLKLDRIDTKRM